MCDFEVGSGLEEKTKYLLSILELLHQNISHKLHHIATLVLCAAENIRPHN